MADDSKKKDGNVPYGTIPGGVNQHLYDTTKKTTAQTIENLRSQSPYGSVDSALADMFYGINHRSTPLAIQFNKDNHGLTLFTKPMLNLNDANCRTYRKFSQMMSNEPNSIQRIIRCSLDPTLSKNQGAEYISTPLVDPYSPFINFLTNNLISINGFPDPVVPIYTTPQGTHDEEYSLIDGTNEVNRSYQITANFRNIPGDPINKMFSVWEDYGSLVTRGKLIPHFDNLLHNRVDYTTRIWRLILDAKKTKVQKIGITGAAFPLNAPIGASFNYESDRPFNNANDQISISFQCMVSQWDDDILVKEFNDLAIRFNPSMADSAREKNYLKLPPEALTLMNNRGYLRINPDNYDLEIWIPKQLDQNDPKSIQFNLLMKALGKS